MSLLLPGEGTELAPLSRSGIQGGERRNLSRERGRALLCSVTTCYMAPNERLLLGREHNWYPGDPPRGRRAEKLCLRLPIATHTPLAGLVT